MTPIRCEVMEKVRGPDDHYNRDPRFWTGEVWHPGTIVHFTDPMHVRIPTGKTERHRGEYGWGGYYDVMAESGVPVKAIVVLDDGRVWDVGLSRVRVPSKIASEPEAPAR